ncbi:hypothetical protein JST97_16470, partial [bacterium]|nr:hypothetical protein [bacterium]
ADPATRTGQPQGGKPQIDPKVGAQDPAAQSGDVARRIQTEPATRTGQP